MTSDPDIAGRITVSNGHNVFGSDVQGNVPGDREDVAPSVVFASFDPATGGGKLARAASCRSSRASPTRR